MKYSANQGCISSFIVGGTRSEYGLPMAVILNFKSLIIMMTGSESAPFYLSK
ncbi:hypothetical protein [Desulfocicer vacuolatum]|uniref:hypothetical protein n=1 Tax=Desulfocicer vacuolatum TaxID=2298 RepID=UPI001481F33E|nr:hypothetical protein [Desulfocicer vacuolatum]